MPIHLPSVSVVIPAWNAGRWLQPAVDSALGQTARVSSVVVVDNASTDGSVQALDRSEPRLRVISLEENHGACHARNLGWRSTVSQWIQFLDADDALHPDKIATQLTSVGDLARVDVVHSPVIHQLWDGDGEEPTSETIQQIDDLRDLESQWLRWEVGQTGALLWKRRALEKIGGWNEDQPCCQDNEITLRAILAGLRFRFAPAAGAIYRHWTEQTLSRVDPTRTLRERAKLMRRMVEWLNNRGSLGEEQQEVVDEEFHAVARSLAATGAAGLDDAERILSDVNQLTPIRPRGRACPPTYRLLHRLLGFRGAERLAGTLRTWRR